MLSCVFICLFVSVLANDVTFRNVTVMGGSRPVNIPSSDKLSLYVPERTIKKIYFHSNDNIPVLYENSVSDLSHLEVLDLTNHSLREIRRGAFKNLPLLDDLILEDNRLEKINDGVFESLKNLTRLSLKRNLIESVSSRAFDGLTSLVFLFLANNQLTTISPDWFKNKHYLALVDLNHNLIENIPDGSLETYHRAIFLGHNLIRNLSREMFGASRYIQELSLHDNEIEDWDEELFENITIAAFDVASNKIECLNGSFEELFAAKYTTIAANPWDCECLEDIVEFKEWAGDELGIDIDVGTSWEECNETKEVED